MEGNFSMHHSDTEPTYQPHRGETQGLPRGWRLSLFLFLITLVTTTAAGALQQGVDPIAFAGWIGLLVTSLNLFPIGQLDGGHVAYAVFGEKHRLIAGSTVAVLVILGLTGWRGWLIWALLSVAIGYRHPPVINPEEPLDRKRKYVGWAAIVIFLLTFTPNPFEELGGG